MSGGLATLALLVGGFSLDDYYASVETDDPALLRSTLHTIIDDHQRIPYTSFETDTWDVLEQADQDRDEPTRIATLYRNVPLTKRGGGNNFYNREHTWPVSYGFPDREDPDSMPFTDMHAMFLADTRYNSDRQNKPFGPCQDNCIAYAVEFNDGRGGDGVANFTSGEFTQGIWEVWPGRRGDVARALLYMDVRYDGSPHGLTGVLEPDLILTDEVELIDASRTGVQEPVAYMGYLSTLLNWHREDPVDDIERQHHEAVFAAQGNRNPFVDRPEWVACVFDGECEQPCLAEPELRPFLATDSARACPGFFIARVAGDHGYWSMEIALTEGSRLLQGGLNLGVGLGGMAQAGFAAFNIANRNNEPQLFDAQITFGQGNGSYLAQLIHVSDNRTVLTSEESSGESIDLMATLNPGFYSVRVISLTGQQGRADIALSTRFTDRPGGAFQGGVNVGGVLGPASDTGFAAICISDAQRVRFSTFGRPTFSGSGVEELSLTVLDRERQLLATAQSCRDE